MDKKDFSNWENDVGSMVKGIMDSIDLTDIKKNINTTLKDLDVAIKTQTNHVVNQVNYGTKKILNNPVKQEIIPVPRSIPGNTSSILTIIFASIGTVVFTPLFLSFFLIGLLSSGMGTFLAISLAIFLPLLLVSTIGLRHGIGVRGRIGRFKTYLKLVHNRSFCKIKELSDAMGKSEQFVLKDLKRMMDRRMFLEGHIDGEQKYLILNHKTYNQYLLTEKEKQRALEQEVRDKAPKSEIEQTIAKGRDYIRQIKAANEAIEEEDISNKLSRLELVTSRIFAFVERNPHKLPEIRKFMEYYLPTTLKLVNAYQEFDSHSFEGETIINAKAEIRQTLDTIIIAFENLFDSFFEDVAMDISTDISVLQSLLAQEGLTNSGFQEDNNKTLQ